MAKNPNKVRQASKFGGRGAGFTDAEVRQQRREQERRRKERQQAERERQRQTGESRRVQKVSPARPGAPAGRLRKPGAARGGGIGAGVTGLGAGDLPRAAAGPKKGKPQITVRGRGGRPQKVTGIGSIDQILAAGPTATGKGKQGPPIGGKYLGTAVGAPKPQYYDGYQWLPATWDPPRIMELQSQLHASGLLSEFQTGVWDRASTNAFEIVLEAANASGQPWEAMVGRLETGEEDGGGGGGSGGGGRGGGGGGGSGGGGGAAGPLPISPLDIESVGNDSALKILGRRLRPNEVPAFDAAFRSVYGAGEGSGGYQAPAADVLGAATVRGMNPAEADATDIVNAYDRFVTVIKGR